ncbi:MAG TPA: NAD/NADP octopine/nopaline dehydrogenase family protein, partial [Bacteroidales bacterium]|nr:NAD/NADP octopine/nopaline dehydrogenase family protein [Bacteroidales bacterium]
EHRFKYYREGISRTVAGFIEKIDKERQDVANLLHHPVISAKEWLQHSYGIECDTLYDCIQKNVSYEEIYAPPNMQYRYIYEDIPYGLVPLESMGKDLGLEMKNTQIVIDLANALLNTDFRASGRTAEKLHFDYKKLMRGVTKEDLEEENKKEEMIF